MSNAGSGDGPGTQRDRPELLPSWRRNQPLLGIGRESQDGEVAPGVDQGRTYPAQAQLLQGGIDGHAFGDPSKVELDADGQCHAPAYRIIT